MRNLAKLNIPQRYRAPLSSIRFLSEESVQKIRFLLDQVVLAESSSTGTDAQMPSDPGAVITAVKSSASVTDIPNLKDLLETLAALYEIKAQRDSTIKELVDDICDAMEAIEPDLQLPDAERGEFSEKLLTLLSADVFSIVTKAHDLATEGERIFCHARMLTDLRPVFGANIKDGPRAMVVMHTFKLAYHEQGSRKDHGEFYVTLDAEDLQKLKDIIERAEAKAKTLASILKNVHVFGIPKE
jgi:hypothetical protein